VDPYKIHGLHINCSAVGHMIDKVVNNKSIKNRDDLNEIYQMRWLWFQEDNQAALSGAFEHLSMDEIKAQYETNVFGLIRTTQAVLPIMEEQKSGILPTVI
jgi:NAD(P)-dependent dehydrogenase (short-subunit alcohol dehydrogenase family)